MLAITDDSIGFHLAGHAASAGHADRQTRREEASSSIRRSDDRASLLQAIVNGDRDALRQLHELNAANMLAIAIRILRRRDLAEEALHDAFISLWTNAYKYDRHLSAPTT
ncbi:MAG: hypothetical protein EXR39_15185 [Betaproteobacteria bacterium]|nr:hypothetical protein [Betaproteobacteria bacterium]